MDVLLVPIAVPLIAGLIAFIFPRRTRWLAEILALLASAWALVGAAQVFLRGGSSLTLQWLQIDSLTLSFDLAASHLSAFIVLFVAIFGFLVVVYSLGYMAGAESRTRYYAFVLWTIGAAAGAVLSNNLLLLLIFWEIVTVTLFLLVNLGKDDARAAAMKSFAMLGFSDCAMLFGILLVWHLTGTLAMDQISVQVGTSFTSVAFLLLFVGAIAKAGAMPLHSWIPTIAEAAPTPVMALLPAALDKLLGIYFLARISLHLFSLNYAMQTILMVLGAATIVLAVMMALVQHDLKKLLSFHAVSQVGYMVLGIGTGVTVGILGGLFHMLNNAIYKSCLFLGAGAAEKRTGTGDLANMGGLASAMPVSFVTSAIAALAISGVPPLNGFVSKWMVYQGVIELRSSLGPVLLVAAMFGSALTLASFVKVIYSVFLGQKIKGFAQIKEVGLAMLIPMVVLALLCLLFGIFAQFALQNFIDPVLGVEAPRAFAAIQFREALWSPSLATLLIIIGLAVGLVIYLLGRATIRRPAPVFVGGEVMDPATGKVPGTGFYDTIRLTKGLRHLYTDGERSIYDLYFLTGRLGGGLVNLLRNFHNGIMSTYLTWCIIGLLILAIVLVR